MLGPIPTVFMICVPKNTNTGTTNGANDILRSGGKTNYMPRFYRRKRRSSYSNKKRLQHSPSSMGNSVPTFDQLVTYAVVSERLAGTALSTSRSSSDRQTEVQTGGQVGFVTWDVSLSPGGIGSIEYCVFKAERQFTTPVVGTDPIPADADLVSSSMQSEYRMNMPGWILKFGILAVASEQPRTLKVTVNLKKFKKSTFRDGDFLGLAFFNRVGASTTIGWAARYWEYN